VFQIQIETLHARKHGPKHILEHIGTTLVRKQSTLKSKFLHHVIKHDSTLPMFNWSPWVLQQNPHQSTPVITRQDLINQGLPRLTLTRGKEILSLLKVTAMHRDGTAPSAPPRGWKSCGARSRPTKVFAEILPAGDCRRNRPQLISADADGASDAEIFLDILRI